MKRIGSAEEPNSLPVEMPTTLPVEIMERTDDPSVERVERIIDLSNEALLEKDREKFSYCLKKRSELISLVSGEPIEVGEILLKTWLEVEQKILNRLEEERRNVLREMDALSKRRMATRHYSPRYPLPPMPVFLDKRG
jgi:hypothetical protein